MNAGFSGAAHVVRLSVLNQRLVANALEPRSLLALPEGGRLAVYNASQAPTLLREMLANSVLHEPEENIHVVVGDIGGGFGMKASVHNEEAVAVFAARRLDRPVRYVAERGEEFLSSVHGRDQYTEAALALDADGRILGMKVDTLAATGAYLMPFGLLVPLGLGRKSCPACTMCRRSTCGCAVC